MVDFCAVNLQLWVDNISGWTFCFFCWAYVILYLSVNALFLAVNGWFLVLIFGWIPVSARWQPSLHSLARFTGDSCVCTFLHPLPLSLQPYHPFPIQYLYSCLPSSCRAHAAVCFIPPVAATISELLSLLSASSYWDLPPFTKPHQEGRISSGQHVGSIIQTSLPREMTVLIMSVYMMDRWEAAKYTFTIQINQVRLPGPDSAAVCGQRLLSFTQEVWRVDAVSKPLQSWAWGSERNRLLLQLKNESPCSLWNRMSWLEL